jgi:hypothetical protein
MSGAYDFVAGLAGACKGYKEIKETVDAAFGDKTLQKTAIYSIIKKVKAGKDTADQRHPNPKKTVRIAALIASVAAAVEEDRWVMIESLSAAHGSSLHTIHRILYGPRKEDSKKGAQAAQPRSKSESMTVLNSLPLCSATPLR